jgi:hypothetical protein
VYGLFDGVSIASSGATWHRAGRSAALTSGTTYAVTVLYAAGTSGNVLLQLRNASANEEVVISGTVDAPTLSTTTLGTVAGLSVRSTGSLRELSFTLTAATTGTVSVAVGPNSATAGQTVLAYAAQVEAGSFATSWIISDGVAQTRAADEVLIADAAAIVGDSGFTLATTAETVAVGVCPILSFDDDSADNRIEFYTTGTDLRLLIASGGATQVDMSVGTAAAGVPFALAARLAGNDLAVSVNGTSVVVDSSLELPTIDRVRIGANQSGVIGLCSMQKLEVYQSKKSDAWLEAYS